MQIHNNEILPRLSGEVTYNRRSYSNLTSGDILGQGCDYYLAGDPVACAQGFVNFTGDQYDFYSLQAPVDDRLPEGGGYVIRGLNNRIGQGALPSNGTVTTVRKELEYTWNGVDTNFVYRGPAGVRVSGGSSTGRSLRNTCLVDTNQPAVKGREGNLYGGGCRINNPYQTNVRANASYTVPFVDVLVGTVFQWRPGATRSANLNYSNVDVVWEPNSAYRAALACDTNGAAAGGEAVGCFFTGGANPATDATTNILDFGDMYGERIALWDLNFQKNIRFLGKRLNFGVEVYNVFNSDAVTGYNNTYTAFRLPDGTWVEDNPNTADVEVNNWGNPTGLVAPRFMRFSMEFHF